MTFSISSFNTHLNGMHFDKKTYYDLQAVMKKLSADINVYQEIIFNEDEYNQIFLNPDHQYIFHHLGDYKVETFIEVNGDVTPKPISLLFSTKFPILTHEIINVGRYGSDPRSSALKVTCMIEEREVDIFALHLTVGLLPLGSFLQLRSLRKHISAHKPTIFIGDHNLWDFLVRLILPRRFRQNIRGATWPAKKPRHQIDQIFSYGLTSDNPVIGSSVGSDHLSISCHLTFVN